MIEDTMSLVNATPADKLNNLLSDMSAPPLNPADDRTARWASCAVTHTGYVRKHNEDAILDNREQGLWLVADGMGGHWGGDQASQTIVDAMVDFNRQQDLSDNVAEIELRLKEANRTCMRTGAKSGKKRVMGSTAAMLFAHDPFCFFIWVGDSRVYRRRGGETQQMTHDHSLVQELVDQGKITKKEAEKHPSGNVITRAVGVAHQLKIDLEFATTEPGDTFLLCSDGLYRHVSDEEIGEHLRLPNINDATSKLLALALSRGGSDNISIVVARTQNH